VHPCVDLKELYSLGVWEGILSVNSGWGLGGGQLLEAKAVMVDGGFSNPVELPNNLDTGT